MRKRKLTHRRAQTVASPAPQPQLRVAVPTTEGTQRYDARKFMEFASQNRIQLRDLAASNWATPTYAKYTKSQIVGYLENPANNERILRQMSQYLYNISNYYRRLIQYFANMPTFAYVLSPYKLDLTKADTAKVEKAYTNAANTITNMNIPHEFSKVLNVAFRDDVFYGYIFEAKDSFCIQQLNADYCKISSIEDGVYNFAFDFSYFDSNSAELPNYAPEFTTMYNSYKSQGNALKWQELDSKKSICIKINETEITPIPPFVSLFSALADIEDYRAISLNASETSNYKALALEIPIDPGTGEFLIDYELAKEFYHQLENVLPENIGVILTPMGISAWDFEKSGMNSESSLVTNAEAVFWSQAGVNKILFGGGEDPSANTLGLSTISDQAIVFRALRQIERWINRKLKSLNGTVKFKINLLDVTRYNQKEMHDQYLKDGQYGLPTRSAIVATSGIAQAEAPSLAYLENSVLEMFKYEIPLQSSNVQSGDPGRPEGETVSDEGEASREGK